MRASSGIAAAVLGAAVIAGVSSRHIIWRDGAAFSPTAFVVAALADIATVVVLAVLGRSARPSAPTLLLALFYAVSAVVALTALLTTPLLPGGPAIVRGAAPIGLKFVIGWQFASGLTGLVYALVRGRAADRFSARGALIGVFAMICVLALAVVHVVAVVNPRSVADAAALTPLFRGVVAPAIALCCVIGAACAFRVRGITAIDHAFAYAVLAAAAEVGLVALVRDPASIALLLARLLYAGASILVLVAAVRMLFHARERLRVTEAALLHSQIESERHAERVRSLWKIASAAEGHDDARLQAVLDIGARTLRSDRRFVGFLSHLEHDRVVVDAVSHRDDDAATTERRVALRPGFSFALERSLHKELYAIGRSTAWDDLGGFFGRDLAFEEVGWHSLIAVPLQIGRRTHFFGFGSPLPMSDAPFTESDLAYLDVLGTFLAHQFSERQQRERLQYQIEHDALTGLKNRAQFRAALRADAASGTPFALALLNLDRFRAVNETSGHLVADELLVEVAVSLASVDERDFVARTSGDDFAIILRDARSAQETAARLAVYASLFRRPFHTGDREGTRMIGISASLGSARCPTDGVSADDVLRSAGVALDAAKERGGDCVVTFDPVMQANLEQRYLQTIELADAIENGELTMVYQPTFELETRAITGAEALVRWNHPTRGQLLPSEFIEFAERNGLIGRLSRWVMERVISDLDELSPLPPGFRCYFNLATAQLDDLAFIAELEARLRFVPWVTGHLGIEVTESAAINNSANSMYALERFRSLGLRIAIDDFGTGYSSLSYLKRLAVDSIKIDRTFISGLPADEKDEALCELLLQIALRFNLTTLAEGIETEAQLRWLLDRGCCFGQGFLVAHPMPLADFAALLPRCEPYDDRGFPSPAMRSIQSGMPA